MNNIWKELSYPDWFESFKRIWGALEISEFELKKTMRMWGITK